MNKCKRRPSKPIHSIIQTQPELEKISQCKNRKKNYNNKTNININHTKNSNDNIFLICKFHIHTIKKKDQSTPSSLCVEENSFIYRIQ